MIIQVQPKHVYPVKPSVAISTLTMKEDKPANKAEFDKENFSEASRKII